ncbi:Protein spinster-like protein 2 isoform X1 [Aix galericulata]|nr:Protein spinster-like protein 2 isoform X1 [Aix galericulata]
MDLASRCHQRWDGRWGIALHLAGRLSPSSRALPAQAIAAGKKTIAEVFRIRNELWPCLHQWLFWQVEQEQDDRLLSLFAMFSSSVSKMFKAFNTKSYSGITKGVLLDIQQHFGVKDSGAGLLQTVFICSFMVAAPIFGYLGDRFNRKIILSCGIFFWSAVTFSSSFITEQYFWLLVLSRGLVGIGEASYSTIAPTIIGDLFTKNTRTLMLSVFYFAIPLGSGLGYITGSSVKQVAGDWHWALRVSPLLGMITGTLILIFVPAAKRGNVEQLGGQLKARTSWLRDMKALIRNRSYVFSSLATSAVSFATGALGMWIPLYLYRAQVVQKTAETCNAQPCGTKDSLIFGAITCFTGFLGVITGAGATKWCRLKTQRADPLVCAVGMLGSAIFICLIFVAAKSSIVGAYYVVIPTRRATAVALQSFTSHLLGDAGSPYLIGFISDLIRQSTKESPLWEFLSLGYALMLCPFVVVLGGMFFLATALFFLSDRAKAEQHKQDPSPSLPSVAGGNSFSLAMLQSSPDPINHLGAVGESPRDATSLRQSLRRCQRRKPHVDSCFHHHNLQLKALPYWNRWVLQLHATPGGFSSTKPIAALRLRGQAAGDEQGSLEQTLLEQYKKEK